MLGKTLLAEKLFCAAVDKFTVGADLVMCEFFAALHTACHQSFTTFARYTFDANGSSSAVRDALRARSVSPVQTLCELQRMAGGERKADFIEIHGCT